MTVQKKYFLEQVFECGQTVRNYEWGKNAKITLDSASTEPLLLDDRKMGASIKAAVRDGRGAEDLWLRSHENTKMRPSFSITAKRNKSKLNYPENSLSCMLG